MTRVTLEFPDSVFTFSTRLLVRMDDVNIGAHLSNDRLVSMIGEARSQFLARRGFSEVGGPDGAEPGIIMADLQVVYRSEASIRDVLRIDVGVSERSSKGAELAYRITQDDDGSLVALASTGVVCFDYRTRRPVTPPPTMFD